MLTPDQTKLRLVEAENRELKAEVTRLKSRIREMKIAVVDIIKFFRPHLSTPQRLRADREIKEIEEGLDKE